MAKSASEVVTLVDRLRKQGDDPLRQQRKETVRYLMPFVGTSAQKAVAAIRKGLR